MMSSDNGNVSTDEGSAKTQVEAKLVHSKVSVCQKNLLFV